jgi:hypothetical protein
MGYANAKHSTIQTRIRTFVRPAGAIFSALNRHPQSEVWRKFCFEYRHSATQRGFNWDEMSMYAPCFDERCSFSNEDPAHTYSWK